jgi:hypothetical protein
VFVDLEDRAAPAAEVTLVATVVAGRFGHPRPPVFGVRWRLPSWPPTVTHWPPTRAEAPNGPNRAVFEQDPV